VIAEHQRRVTSARALLADFESETANRPVHGARSGDWWAGALSVVVEQLLFVIDATCGGER
jgi:hypothetical protein